MTNPVIQKIRLHGKEVDVLRLDKMTPSGIGNKYYKLKYNIERAVSEGYTTLLSFGGAFSNHIHALAAVGQQSGLKTIGVIRGEDDTRNPTLNFARASGMELYFTDRSLYRQKETADFLEQMELRFSRFYMIPEGGSNELAVLGCREILHDVPNDYDHILLACGTGATLAGVIATPGLKANVIGIAVLKGKDTLSPKINELIQPYNISTSWTVNFNYHLGGYAKWNADLMDFIHKNEEENMLETDPIYTSKVLWACADMLEHKLINKNQNVLIVHTGGLQGWDGWNYRYGNR